MTTIETLLAGSQEAWDDAQILRGYGRELHDRNRLDHARRVLERVLELEPQDAESWAYLSYACFRSLRDQEGREVLRRALESTTDTTVVSALSHFTDDDDERTRLKAALEKDHSPSARASLLGHRMWAGEPAEALEALRSLAAEHPEDEEVRSQLLWSLLGLKGRQLLEGLDLSRDGAPLAEKTIRSRPNEVHGYWMKAQMYLAERDWDGVLDTTERALSLFPDEETMMQYRARALAETGNTAEAMHWYSRAIGAKPSFAGARVELGKLYEREGRMELAEQVLREIPEANPDYVLGPVSVALFLARRERWEEAERVFLDVWPRIPAMWQASVRNNPDAHALLERDAVKAVVGAGEAD